MQCRHIPPQPFPPHTLPGSSVTSSAPTPPKLHGQPRSPQNSELVSTAMFQHLPQQGLTQALPLLPSLPSPHTFNLTPSLAAVTRGSSRSSLLCSPHTPCLTPPTTRPRCPDRTHPTGPLQQHRGCAPSARCPPLTPLASPGKPPAA